MMVALCLRLIVVRLNAQPIISQSCPRPPETAKRMASQYSNGMARLWSSSSQTITSNVMTSGPILEELRAGARYLFVVRHDHSVRTSSIRDDTAVGNTAVYNPSAMGEQRTDPPTL